jgi:2-keto-4-pentenoate hydratase/2-oxohepta-3-ene-1,7-dioic acid hydratase in catechol pathway
MKLVRFYAGQELLQGLLDGDFVRPLEDSASWDKYDIDRIRLAPPVEPTKIVAVGLNYRDHAEELGLAVPQEPLLFMKPSSSVIGHGDSILLPPQSSRVDYEAELGVVIGKPTRKVSAKEASDHILGYTCLNDVTARDLQEKDGQWIRAKGFDTFCPIGPCIEAELDPSDLAIDLYLNGSLKQTSRTSMLIFSPAELVEFISGIMTLWPGDVIATGTTSGIGPMKEGDSVEVRIEGIGSLVNSVRGAE